MVDGGLVMRFVFDLDWLVDISITVDANLHYFPCDRTFVWDILAFFNGGFPDDSSYGFLTEQGLLHFAFLTNQLDEYHARWRLKYFDCRECQGLDSWF